MKGFKLNLFLFIIRWSIIILSVDENEIHSALELQTIHHETSIKKNDSNANNIVNATSDTVDYSQAFLNPENSKKICYGQVNEFVWNSPTISDSEERVLKFHTIDDDSSLLTWYLKSINGINIVEMSPGTDNHQIQFYVKIHKRAITLSRLYPSYPEISGFAILQFISNLAFQCKFLIEVLDLSDVSKVYSALYGKRYYKYHFKGIDMNHNFLFTNIVVKKKNFLDCFEKNIRGSTKLLSQLFCENIQACARGFVPVEFCPITFDTQRIFYEKSFQYCIDWSAIGGFPQRALPLPQHFEITLEDITRIMKRKEQSNDSFVKINWTLLDKKIIKTYDEIKTQIVKTSFLMESFSNIFKLCFVELEKTKSHPNPEDIFKLYLRPCVMPNINLFLKYYTDI